jgi:enoyl-CoA hydratase
MGHDGPMTERIHSERSGGAAVITVDAPDRRNALTLDLSAQLTEAVADAERDSGCHVVIITGTPPAFCAGADLSALGAAKEEGLRAIYEGFLAVARCTLPTIAAVGGAAVGAGLNLALATDVRLAGPHARFDARFLQLGLHPGGGMTWMLQRAVGTQQATAMTLFGEILGADAAERAGLVLRAVEGDHERLLEAAKELARPAVEAPRDLVVTVKASMRTTREPGTHEDAVNTELAPQLASLESPEFADRLARARARIKSGTGGPGRSGAQR